MHNERQTTSLPNSPDGFGIAVVDVARRDDAPLRGWTLALAVPGDLHGPAGILQGGLSSSLGWIAARTVLDECDAVPGLGSVDISTVHAKLRRPTPVGAMLHVDVHVEDLTDLHVEVRNGDEVTIRTVVDVSGPPPVPLVGDLDEVAKMTPPPAKEQRAYPLCVVCGPDNPRGLHVPPHPFGTQGLASAPWVPDERVDDGAGRVHPTAIAAVLDCPGVWAGWYRMGAEAPTALLLADYRLQVFERPPLGSSCRTVARVDDLDDRTLQVRTGLYDDGGRMRALATAVHVIAPGMPPTPTPATALSGAGG